ncbi:hypothetical protein [Paenibacillus soyae]|uniref:Uncharacterized protein n=1 Tax=Paenibacillus soyae TaxID=2969249 RepID=A0A9X2SBG0_9BACL|nr:hypothetical protein [Paenibacillus soyae]MCR2804802.1 hypothetical protein [Paenibacillus soyae]
MAENRPLHVVLRELGWSYQKIKRLFRDGIISPIESQSGTLIPVNQLEHYLLFEKELLEHFSPARTTLKNHFGYHGSSSHNILYSLRDQGFIVLKELPYKVNSHKLWVSKQSLSLFSQLLETEYIEFKDALIEFNLSKNQLTYRISKEQIPTITLGKKYFILKNNLKIHSVDRITADEVVQLLHLPKNFFQYYGYSGIFQDVIGSDHATKYFALEEVIRVQKEIHSLRDQYYTLDEAEAIIRSHGKSVVIIKSVESIATPLIAKSFAPRTKKLYLRTSLHHHLNTCAVNSKKNTNKNTIDHHLYLSKQETTDLTGWHSAKVTQLIIKGHLEKVATIEGLRVTRESVLAYKQFEKNISEQYMTPNELIIDHLGYKKTQTNIVEVLEHQGFIEVIVLDQPIQRFNKWVSRVSVSTFFERLHTEFATFDDVAKQLHVSPFELHLRIKIKKLTTIKIKNTVYLKKDELTTEFHTPITELLKKSDSLLSKTTVMQTMGWSAKKVNLLIRSKQLDTVKESGTILIDSSSLAKYVEFEQDIKRNYISARQALIQYFGFKAVKSFDQLYSLKSQGYIELQVFNDYSIDGSTLWVSKLSLEQLFKRIQSDFTESKALMNELHWSKYQLQKRMLTESWLTVKIKGLIYIHNDSINRHRIKTYPIHEALNMLGIPLTATIYKWYHIIFDSDKIIGNQVKFVPESEIVRIQQEIQTYREIYYTSKETVQLLKLQNISDSIYRQVEHIECPYIAKSFAGNCKRLFLKTSVHEYMEKNKYIRLNNSLNNLNGTHLIFSNTVEYVRHHISEYHCNPSHTETKKLIEQFAVRKLTLSKASVLSKEKSARELVIFTHTLFSLLPMKEIFMMETDEVRSFIETDERIKIKCTFYEFLKFCKEKHICKYEMSYIRKPLSTISYEEKDVYDFDQFIAIYNYATKNLKSHQIKAIESSRYSSTHLYVLMHLSNAWRHSDVMMTPPVYPEAIGITEIQWFLTSTLTLPQAQTIINQLQNFKLVISKTGMRRHFFCNKDLVIPIATAMVIAEFHRKKLNRPYLINFRSNNNRVPESALEEFFENGLANDQSSVKFSSLKMNRSLMTHLFYSIQQKEGKGNSAFELVQKLRNHVTDITKEYVLHDIEKISDVSMQMFERGEFGYIYDQLLDVLSEEELSSQSLQDRTSAIIKLKQRYLPHQVESLSDFLDTMELEKKTIIMQIQNMSKEHAFEYIRKLYLGEMPSKLEGIQCFSFPKCHRPSAEFKCSSCPFAIPNIYALTALSNDIKVRIQKYNSTIKSGAKRKEFVLLQRTLDLLFQALEEFEEEFVWSFIPGGEEFIESQLAAIEEV